jgi:hypothetical protein
MKTARVAAAWAEQITLVFCVFTPIAFVVGAYLFSDAPGFWLAAGVTGISAGLGGAMGWAIACGRLARPAWWRVLISGILAGLLVHPWFLFLGACISFQPISFRDLLTGWLFSLLVMGVVTLPAGVLAALCCRFIGGQLMRNRD